MGLPAQTLLFVVCSVIVTSVSSRDLFRLIAEETNPIMQSLLWLMGLHVVVSLRRSIK